MKSYRDKNDFEVNAGEDWDDKKSDETVKYLTGKRNMETFVKNNNANNVNPGTFKKLVKEDEEIAKQVRDYAPHKVPTTRLKPLIDVEKILEENEAEAMEKRGQQTVALRTAANKLKTNKADYVLTEDPNGLMVNKNRTIAVRDSFIAKQFNRALEVEPEATPEQFGRLAANLERNRQSLGKPTNVKEFKKNFNKPIQKKPIKKIPTKPFKFPEFKIDPVLPASYFKPTAPDPELARLERNFNRMVEESNRPKGLPGILGLRKRDYE